MAQVSNPTVKWVGAVGTGLIVWALTVQTPHFGQESTDVIITITYGLALLGTCWFGLPGLVAAVIGTALAGDRNIGSYQEDLQTYLVRLGELAIELGVGFVASRPFLASPLTTRKVAAAIGAAVIGASVTEFVWTVVFDSGFTMLGSFAAAWLQSLVTTLILGYVVVLPGYIFLTRRRAASAVSVTGSVLQGSTSSGESEAMSDFVDAEYGVPHAKFQRTDDGFKVSFNKTSPGLYKIFHRTSPQNAIQMAAAFFVLFPILGVVLAIQKLGKGTQVEVTADSVIIDGKRMRRAEFAGFSVYEKLKAGAAESEVAILGYGHGSRSYSFGGVWNAGDAAEVASALNRHLRIAPAVSRERPSPAKARANRTSDF